MNSKGAAVTDNKKDRRAPIFKERIGELPGQPSHGPEWYEDMRLHESDDWDEVSDINGQPATVDDSVDKKPKWVPPPPNGKLTALTDDEELTATDSTKPSATNEGDPSHAEKHTGGKGRKPKFR